MRKSVRFMLGFTLLLTGCFTSYNVPFNKAYHDKKITAALYLPEIPAPSNKKDGSGGLGAVIAAVVKGKVWDYKEGFKCKDFEQILMQDLKASLNGSKKIVVDYRNSFKNQFFEIDPTFEEKFKKDPYANEFLFNGIEKYTESPHVLEFTIKDWGYQYAGRNQYAGIYVSYRAALHDVKNKTVIWRKVGSNTTRIDLLDMSFRPNESDKVKPYLKRCCIGIMQDVTDDLKKGL